MVTPEVVILCKKLARDGTEDREFFIDSLTYTNKLAYLQPVTVYGNSPLKSHEQDCLKL